MTGRTEWRHSDEAVAEGCCGGWSRLDGQLVVHRVLDGIWLPARTLVDFKVGGVVLILPTLPT